ncbi:trans-resveratrol di-O-methyltransferase-like [Dioscorea cayenensis subsp. rotundata]|uniref:Trans-resveratrol di-O-methyltransferase-like n=1 Tax=Dioscorea cayennensis subsp. rotundata TaxID=55577 RepID=A0AB40BG10_DIOCR|nr:trans-resveratrol di-O-methyltransferase-like [Dioscorea cayenensis subsp. rotundata]
MDQLTTTELLQAQSHALNLIFGYFKSISFKAAIDLGIADILHKHGKPMSLAQLTTSLSIPTSKSDPFRRLMRALVHQGIFSTDQETQSLYSLTPTSQLLLPGNSTPITPFLSLIVDPTVSHPSYDLGSWFKSPEDTPFEFLHGKAIIEVAGEKPEFKRLLNEGKASYAGLVMDAVMRSCGDVFGGVESLVDVGGGTGAMAIEIKKAFPEMKCTVLDLPHVVQGKIEIGGVGFVAGDMFESVPPASVAMLKWVLHDWSDEDCIKILKRCKEAIPNKDNEGKIIIIDTVVGPTKDNYVSEVETQVLFDLLMLVTARGKQRNESEWRNIFTAAGFDHYKVTPLMALQSVIEVYP